ncbi:nucleotide-diphospho-sugar transferase [Lutibacter sp. A80]|uniref:nucleotidyltransferase family protein n=1 Tax=unclassified Lutibacter TaxID=2626258 RepID=UPI001F0523A3|nr:MULTISPECIES: sugar phosphate nucleotidyltransferase [unclassified Lutibacter]UMB53855.1 nucleotide-diphospho-sugar transferase [Lutibacter sp. A64]UMB60583.1 nucleotide-diphospho-sugar transferase [Lutibacter sp. A80]
MSKPTLVILAAGIGSRYGGLKQLDTFSEQGDTILDFSIYDAIQAGFGKVVFIIRKSIEADFKAFFTPKLKDKIEVEYVFQELENIPEKYKDNTREKPWGTGHALLMAKDVISENFTVINADDFYGREAFVGIAEALKNIDKNSSYFNMMGYVLKNTISEYGFVSRGECRVDENGFLTGITERTHIEKVDGILKFKETEGVLKPISEETIVSMNFFGFTPKYFELSESLFEEFLEENYKEPKAEFFIPKVVNHLIVSGKATMEVLKSDARWFGVTYKEDKAYVTSEIQKLKEAGVYPAKLW